MWQCPWVPPNTPPSQGEPVSPTVVHRCRPDNRDQEIMVQQTRAIIARGGQCIAGTERSVGVRTIHGAFLFTQEAHSRATQSIQCL